MRHLKNSVILSVSCFFLAGCIDDLITTAEELEAETTAEIAAANSGSGSSSSSSGTSSSGGSSSGASYTIRAANFQCPSQCTLNNSSAEVQAASQCDAARVRYSSYEQNARAFQQSGPRCETVNGVTGCVDLATLGTLYSQFSQQNDLAGEFYRRVGC